MTKSIKKPLVVEPMRVSHPGVWYDKGLEKARTAGCMDGSSDRTPFCAWANRNSARWSVGIRLVTASGLCRRCQCVGMADAADWWMGVRNTSNILSLSRIDFICYIGMYLYIYITYILYIYNKVYIIYK